VSQPGKAKGQACPQCGKTASGNFCQHCGAALGGRFCNQCGSELRAGARFCNHCGAPAGAGGGAAAAPVAAHRAAAAATLGGSNLPWWIAGVAMFGLILAVGLSVVSAGGPESGGATGGAAGGDPAAGTSSIDLNSMTPREAADRLFDRVMRTAADGDSAGARAFVPMAIQAYQLVEPLDLDGLVHVSMLQSTGMRYEDALATAEQILVAEPDHVLGLGSAADALRALGRTDEATERYRRLLEVYDAEVARQLPEHAAHDNLMLIKRDEARAFLAGG
jgi:tetratricopeptide (TPR) repeat protein